MKKLKYQLFALIMILLFLSPVQKRYHIFSIKQLEGDFILASKPEFSKAGWFSGKFQDQLTDYLEQHIGFRNLLVRINNQFDFSLFRKTHAEGVIVGKNDVLFEYDYIRAYLGDDFIGEKTWDKKMRRLKYVQEYLKKNKNIDLILVLEPSKARYDPEFIPDRYDLAGRTISNYEFILKKADELEISYVDMNKYYRMLKETASYSMYPQYGVHWSNYGMAFVADSLIKYMENLRQIDMPEMYIDSLEITTHPRPPDYDAGKPLNLLWELPHKPMAYPVFAFEDNGSKDRPMVLNVGDSYYWNMYNALIPKHLFGNMDYWYFNKLVFPASWADTVHVNTINVQWEVEKQDIVLLMVTERFLHKYDFGFVDNLFKIYTPALEPDFLYNYENRVRMNIGLFDRLAGKANSSNNSLEKLIRSEAEYLFSATNLKKYLEITGPEYYQDIIDNDTTWANSIVEKAKKKKITYDEALWQDSDYIFFTKYPEIHKKYHRLKLYEENILNDSTRMEAVSRKANYYYLTLDEMITQEAGILYNKEIASKK
ncbi:MAG: hypothetical protein KAG99_01980 [Bacteroidales bacterium]|nr:hypothetical protein [Bacteroidales bacterium]